jgi:hypothetical protein
VLESEALGRSDVAFSPAPDLVGDCACVESVEAGGFSDRARPVPESAFLAGLAVEDGEVASDLLDWLLVCEEVSDGAALPRWVWADMLPAEDVEFDCPKAAVLAIKAMAVVKSKCLFISDFLLLGGETNGFSAGMFPAG